MKKILILALALILVLSLAACGGTEAPVDGNDPGTEQQEQQPGSTNDDEGGKEVVKTNWKNAEVEEYYVEDFAELTSGIPEPEGSYTINAVAIVQGLMFDLSSDADAEAWKQAIEAEGFAFVEEYFGVQAYENDTHRIQFSGTSITIKLK